MRRLRPFAGPALVALATVMAASAWAEKPPALAGEDPGVAVAPIFVPPATTAPVSSPPAPAPPLPPAATLAPAVTLGSHLGNERPVVGTPASAGAAITGDMQDLSPSERLAGREAALRFRFQQQLRSGDVPWTPRDWRN